MDTKDIERSDRRKQEEVDDITTCCICLEVFTDPKALPCIHTFCMKCLQEIGFKTGKGPGAEMPCPICGRLFKIPPEGFPGLPKHFFIERLIQVSTVPNRSTSVEAACDACLEETKEESGKEIPQAGTYCVDCNQKYCEECCRQHRKFKLTKNHKMIQINEHDGGQNFLNNLTSSVCKVHVQKVLDVYCADCKTVLCAICFIEEHKSHEGSHVEKLVDGFRKQVESNAEAIKQYRSKAETKKVELMKAKEDLQNVVEKLECDVTTKKDELKQLTEKHEASLLQDVYLIKQSKLKEIKMAMDDVDTYLSSLETYNSYCKMIIDKGSANDICGAMSDLSVTTLELQQQCQPLIEREIQFSNMCFSKSGLCEFLEENCVNSIGEIEESQNVEQESTRKTTETKLKEFEAQLIARHAGNDKLRLEDVEAKLLDLTRDLEEERKGWVEERKQLTKQAQEMQQELSDSKEMMVDLEIKFEGEKIAWEEEKKQLIKEVQELQTDILDNSRAEATFRYTFNNTSQLKSSCLSPPCYVRNLPWKIMAKPQKSQKNFGFFLQCGTESDSQTWSCNCTAELKILNKKPDGKPLIKKIQHLFNSKENDWGYGNFISMSELLDPEKGYVKDDVVTLEVYVKADAPHGVK